MNNSTGPEAACEMVMSKEEIPAPVIKNFLRLLSLVKSGVSGEIAEDEISAVPPLHSLEKLKDDEEIIKAGMSAMDSLVICKLNGGLGTGMGLQAAKSLLPVKDELTFNDLNARQVLFWQNKTGRKVPFLNMTSFSTDRDVRCALGKNKNLDLHFLLQNKHPKLLADTLMPAGEAENEMSWNPPGHGDIYPALVASGLLTALLSAGNRYMFVSNSDNTAATPDAAILGYLVLNRTPFLMEVTARTSEDKKGGHIALRKKDNRLILRETAQAPKEPNGDPSPAFQDIEKYRFFNTNNLWLDLEALKRVLDEYEGIMPLPLIRNPKTLDPRESTSPAVFQLETAMGAAIELFEGARAIAVPRSRFAPVKNTSDLLRVRSDAYTLTEAGLLKPCGIDPFGGLPLVKLDKAYYTLLDAFDARFKVVPSLKDASSFEVSGNVSFLHKINVSGNVKIIDVRKSKNSPFAVPANITSLRDEVLQLNG